jgi:hypothetical protein
MEENLLKLAAQIGAVVAGIWILAALTGTGGPMSAPKKKSKRYKGKGDRWVTGEVAGGITSGAHLVGSSFPG